MRRSQARRSHLGVLQVADKAAEKHSYRDFRLANQRMAASFKAKGYHYHFDFAKGAGHVDGNVVAQTLPDALAWAFRGYPLP